MKQHTPTPWTTRPVYENDGRHEIRSAGCDTVGYAPLAYVRGDKRLTGGDGAANATFIVRACNAHYELLAAAQMVIEKYDERKAFLELAGRVTSMAGIEELRAAVARAAGGAK
jgi:hypothetical protein